MAEPLSCSHTRSLPTHPGWVTYPLPDSTSSALPLPSESHPAAQETGRLRPAVGRGGHGAAGGARLQVCLHLHPGAVPQPGAERPGKDKEEVRLRQKGAQGLTAAPWGQQSWGLGWDGVAVLTALKGLLQSPVSELSTLPPGHRHTPQVVATNK